MFLFIAFNILPKISIYIETNTTLENTLLSFITLVNKILAHERFIVFLT